MMFAMKLRRIVALLLLFFLASCLIALLIYPGADDESEIYSVALRSVAPQDQDSRRDSLSVRFGIRRARAPGYWTVSPISRATTEEAAVVVENECSLCGRGFRVKLRREARHWTVTKVEQLWES